MLNIGDYALHKESGKMGKIIAYGHEIVDGAYLSTLKVELEKSTEMNETMFLEDVSNAWVRVDADETADTKLQAAGVE